MENMLGIIGGMGPLASQYFCKLIIDHTKASKDSDHINFMMLNHATMPDRTAAILAGETDQLKKLLMEDCRTLESAGCKAICIPCNTSHYIVHQFEDQLSIPVISIIRETAKEMAARHEGEKVGIMATDGTIKTRIYQDALEAAGVEVVLPSEESQKLVMKLIYDVKAGKCCDPMASIIIENEFKAAGCEEVLLACTELPLLKESNFFDDAYYYTDPMEIMAVKAIEFMGKEVK